MSSVSNWQLANKVTKCPKSK